MELEKVYVVTMWSGGKPSRKWKTLEKPELLAHGTGLRFISMDTRLEVQVIGSLSVEEYEQGSDELFFIDSRSPTEGPIDTELDEPHEEGGPTLRLL